MTQAGQSPRLAGYGNDRSGTGAGPHHRTGDGRHRQPTETIAESPVWACTRKTPVSCAMDEWNRKTHARSGLIERVRTSVFDEAAVEAAALAFVQAYVPQGASPMCGNSIGQDRRFMVKYMPQLEAWFHYRNLDVSTLKELCRRWKPEVAKGFVKRAEHSALWPTSASRSLSCNTTASISSGSDAAACRCCYLPAACRQASFRWRR
jgi:oligoribonuclease (3'-5' exoribonuclease)